MDLISGIQAATEGLKILSDLRKIEIEYDKAELKLKLVDISDKLLEAKEALQDAKERERALSESLEKERQAQKLRMSLKDDGRGRSFLLENNEVKNDVAFCSLCFVREEKLYPMIRQPGGDGWKPSYRCSNCRENYYD